MSLTPDVRLLVLDSTPPLRVVHPADCTFLSARRKFEVPRYCGVSDQTEHSARPRYLEVTERAGRTLVQRQIVGPIVMLNLLRFRTQADYSATPELAPATPITGEEAFARYFAETLPLLRATGGDIVFLGSGGQFLIGPAQ